MDWKVFGALVAGASLSNPLYQGSKALAKAVWERCTNKVHIALDWRAGDLEHAGVGTKRLILNQAEARMFYEHASAGTCQLYIRDVTRKDNVELSRQPHTAEYTSENSFPLLGDVAQPGCVQIKHGKTGKRERYSSLHDFKEAYNLNL